MSPACQIGSTFCMVLRRQRGFSHNLLHIALSLIICAPVLDGIDLLSFALRSLWHDLKLTKEHMHRMLQACIWLKCVTWQPRWLAVILNVAEVTASGDCIIMMPWTFMHMCMHAYALAAMHAVVQRDLYLYFRQGYSCCTTVADCEAKHSRPKGCKVTVYVFVHDS